MKFLFSPVALLLPFMLNGQVLLRYDQSVPVTNNGALSMAWAGGLNTPQVSDIDLDGEAAA